MSRSSRSSKKISRVFRVKFDLVPKGRKRLVADEAQAVPFEWFVKHFGEIEVSPLYRVTVEVV